MLFTKQLDKVAALCQKHGFVYPVERVIGNCNVTGYNFGPLGALLRRNLLSEWWVKVADGLGRFNFYSFRVNTMLTI